MLWASTFGGLAACVRPTPFAAPEDRQVIVARNGGAPFAAAASISRTAALPQATDSSTAFPRCVAPEPAVAPCGDTERPSARGCVPISPCIDGDFATDVDERRA